MPKFPLRSGNPIIRILFAAFAAAALLSGCATSRSADDETDDESVVSSVETNAATEVSTAAVAVTNETPPAVSVIERPSPNWDKRTLPISLIVLHYTAANLRESLNTLTNGRGKNRVSAHYVVAENGTIYRLVSESHRAWHAGVARWRNIQDVNSASIGIEIVNLGHDRYGRPRGYSAKQIEAVTQLCLNIQARYDIQDVVGHSDVAPNRKIDPGELFPWRMLYDRGVRVGTRGYWPRR